MNSHLKHNHRTKEEEVAEEKAPFRHLKDTPHTIISSKQLKNKRGLLLKKDTNLLLIRTLIFNNTRREILASKRTIKDPPNPNYNPIITRLYVEKVAVNHKHIILQSTTMMIISTKTNQTGAEVEVEDNR